MLLKIFKDDYGFHFNIKLGKFNLNTKAYKDYNTQNTIGIRNNTVLDNRFVPFFDYDCILWDFLIQELKYLQTTYLLSDLYIFKSSQKPNSYHVMGLDRLTFKEWLQVLSDASVDDRYRTMPLVDYKSWVLRIGKKGKSNAPKLINILKSPYSVGKKSQGHALFLKLHHKVDISRIKNLDLSTSVYTVSYDTLNFIE